jgi:hypothetical protein
MSRRASLNVLAVCALALVALMSAVASTPGSALVQVDPTAESQTIDAIVAERFRQTAEAAQNPMTATAAFEQTVDAAFNAALTATAEANAPAEPAATPGDTEAFLNTNFNIQAQYARVLCVGAGCPAEVEATAPCLTASCDHAPQTYPIEATFDTIQAAWEAAAPGDLVIVMPGQYRGLQAEEKSGADGAYIHIKAWGAPGSVVVNAVAFPEKDWLRDHFYFIDTSYYIIEGIAFDGAERAGLFFSGYFAETGRFNTHIVVMDVYSHDNGVWGMHSTATSYMVVQDSVFTNSGEEHGLYLSGGGDNMLVRRNVFQDNVASGFQMNADPQTAEGELYYWLENSSGDTCGLDDYSPWAELKACYDQQGLPDLGPFIEDGVGVNVIVEQNVFAGNGREGGAAINLASVRDSVVRNNLIYGSYAGGIACWDNGYAEERGIYPSPYGCQRVTIVNNTMVDPDAGRTAVPLNGNASEMIVANNIIVRERDDAYEILDTSSQGLVSDHNYVYAAYIENPDLASLLDDLSGFTVEEALGNFAAPGIEPWVLPDGAWYTLNPARPDYHLAPGSPLAGAGSPAYVPALDLDGSQRTGADIGALGVQQ